MASVDFIEQLSDPANLSEYTFSSADFGSAAADRYIIVACYSRQIGTPGSLVSVTIGGIAASIVLAATTGPGTGTTHTALAIAAVPNGTTGDVVVTYSAAMLRAGVGIWRAQGISASPHDTDKWETDNASVTMTVDCEAGGFVIAAAAIGGISSWGWTGLTERHDTVVEALTFSGASDVFADTQSGLVITPTTNDYSLEPVAVVASWSAAGPAANPTAILQINNQSMRVGL